MPKNIAFFDFDGTLVKGDSLWPFLIAAAGRRTCYAALAKALWARAFCPVKSDKRSIFKEALLLHTLAGRSVDDLAEAAGRVERWPRWIEETRQALYKHYQKGDHIVIASGGLDLYLKNLLKDIPCDAIICTEMEVKEGKTTGGMRHGNCVRDLKADLIENYLQEHGPFDDSIAYGNLPHDKPMMDKVKKRVII